jgi:transcriptional regulator with XRE-family HTH domain
MDHKEKRRLARTGDADKDAAAFRFRAARRVSGLSQEGLGKAGGVKKAAVSNAEKGMAFPNRSVLLYLHREFRIDLNFMIHGDFAQLPGDVQDLLFDALAALESEPDQSGN